MCPLFQPSRLLSLIHAVPNAASHASLAASHAALQLGALADRPAQGGQRDGRRQQRVHLGQPVWINEQLGLDEELFVVCTRHDLGLRVLLCGEIV